MIMKRAAQIECKRVVKWSAVFQLKIKTTINVINQQVNNPIQITPATNSSETTPYCAFLWA